MSHQCPGPNCTKRIATNQLACPPHWYKVSKPTRDLVWATYRRGAGSDEHVEAVAKAIDEMNR